MRKDLWKAAGVMGLILAVFVGSWLGYRSLVHDCERQGGTMQGPVTAPICVASDGTVIPWD